MGVQIDASAANAANNLTLGVAVRGLVLTVTKGAFRIGGTDYNLVEDQELTVVPDGTHDTSYVGYIVRDRGTDEIYLLADDRVHDGVQEGFTFGKTSPELLHLLFILRVSPGETDLENVNIPVIHIAGS